MNRKFRRALAFLIFAPLLSACAPSPQTSVVKNIAKESAPATTQPSGKYYLDDGPPDVIPEGLSTIPDASPRAERIIAATTRPYTALGQRWIPHRKVRAHRERGIASWYGRRYHGRPTASGEIYDMFKMTAAHPVLAIPSYVRVTRTDTGESVVVRINDRGPFLRGRVIDLSFAAAHRLQIVSQGAAEVIVEAVGANGVLQNTQPNSETNAASLPRANVQNPQTDFDKNNLHTAPSESSVPKFVYIQLGAFAAEENAESLRRRLQTSGPPGLQRKIYRRDDLYLVLIGPYSSEAAAGGDDRLLCAAGWCGFLTRAP